MTLFAADNNNEKIEDVDIDSSQNAANQTHWQFILL